MLITILVMINPPTVWLQIPFQAHFCLEIRSLFRLIPRWTRLRFDKKQRELQNANGFDTQKYRLSPANPFVLISKGSSMATWIRGVVAFLTLGISLTTPPVLGAEVTEDMHTFARIFATLEARDQTGYCAAMHGAPYIGYLNRVCQSAVQNKVKTQDDCSIEKISQQVKSDAVQCLAMPTSEFDATVLQEQKGRKAFISEMKTQGIDGEALIQAERAKLR